MNLYIHLRCEHTYMDTYVNYPVAAAILENLMFLR